MSILRHLQLVAATFVLATSSLVGCMGAPDEDGEENIAEAEGAFGESTCGTTSGIDGSYPNSSWSCGESSSTFTSPNTSYGHTDCTKGWIVDFQNPRVGVAAYAVLGEALPTTQTACQNTLVRLDTYDDAGTMIASTYSIGSWSGGHCTIPYAGGSLYASGGSTAWGRAVAQAFTCNDNLWTCASRTYRKVAVWAQYPVC
ncbi:hypothetical protein [Polyangium sp. 6x1]|uniref:hypothetical protein n=1 Tax=Polyangium sp. 6x1 TaxID=3042689 RepID=UPI0024828BB1|nr:hypothetical protein [Polyangium sp. 6x1]MDI1442653.1 hypothetical protein [Polyangium sp. 6x1]